MPLSKVLFAEHSAVASEQPLASEAGSEVLKRGGNAVDAAVATSLALCVTMPQCCGLGGDFFALYYQAKSGKVSCINSSGYAPSGLTMELLKSRGEDEVPLFGPLSVVVPGYVAGISAFHSKFGDSEFKKLSTAARRLAESGFPVSEGLSRSIRANGGSFGSEAKKVFMPEGTPPSPGSPVKQERLAGTIASITSGGAEEFYGGQPADEIVERLNELGVPAKKKDFRAFKPEWPKALSFDYRGTTVYEVPPNSMGATCLLMLKVLSGRDLSKSRPLSWERVHATLKAAELAYERKDRMLGDPRFSKVDMEAFMKVEGSGPPAVGKAVREGDTTAFSVVDPEGNIVSGIQSLFHHFGSRVFVEDCGVMLSNRGAGFRSGGPNELEPGKRPLHTLSTLLLDRGDGPALSIGCSGGEYRPMQHTLFVTNLVDYHMSLDQAIDHPRFLMSGARSMLAEGGYGDLSGLQYEVQHLPHPGPTGVCQAIEVLKSSKEAVCDVRGDGLPAGN